MQIRHPANGKPIDVHAVNGCGRELGLFRLARKTPPRNVEKWKSGKVKVEKEKVEKWKTVKMKVENGEVEK